LFSFGGYRLVEGISAISDMVNDMGPIAPGSSEGEILSITALGCLFWTALLAVGLKLGLPSRVGDERPTDPLEADQAPDAGRSDPSA